MLCTLRLLVASYSLIIKAFNALLRCPRDGSFQWVLPPQTVHGLLPRDHIYDIYCSRSHDDVLLGHYLSFDLLPSVCHHKGLSVYCMGNEVANVTLLHDIVPTIKLLFLINVDGRRIVFKGLQRLLVLSIEAGYFQSLSFSMFQNFLSLTTFSASNCSLAMVGRGTFNKSSYLTHLSIEANPLQNLEDGVFSSLLLLKHLSLRYTFISVLSLDTFINNNELILLDLSYTNLVQVDTLLFSPLVNLQKLDLSHSLLSPQGVSEKDTFSGLTLLVEIRVPISEICCLMEDHIRCIPYDHVHGHKHYCNDIIDNRALFSLTQLFTLLIALFNGISLFWNAKHFFIFGNFLQALCNASEFILLIYLGIIISVNYIYYSQKYFLSMIWKTSRLCKLAGFFLSTSLLLSNLSALCVAIDRLDKIVLRPFTSTKYAYNKRAIPIILILMLLFTVIVAMASGLSQAEILNNTCVMLGRSLQNYYVILYIFLTGVMMLMKKVIYPIIMITIARSARKVKKTKNKSIIVICRLLMSMVMGLPSALSLLAFGIDSLVDSKISVSSETIVTFIVFPLSCILNSLINTLLTTAFLEWFAVTDKKDIFSKQIANSYYWFRLRVQNISDRYGLSYIKWKWLK